MNVRLPPVFALLALPAFAADLGAPVAAVGPRLGVVIVIDQCRADYLVRFRPYFGEGGFKRLLEGGADYRNSHFRHAFTVTAPGHAAIATGVHANLNGIVGNDWVDRESWERVNNVEDRTSPLVGLDPRDATAALLAPKAGRSPRNLKASTVADQLKLRYGANSVVFCASNKDRSAILMGGKLADGAYWDENGSIVTGRYYREALPDWIKAFNAERLVHAAFGREWQRLLEPAVYDLVQGGPDDAPGESVTSGLTRTFPKVITGGEARISPRFFTAFDNSTFSAEFIGGFAERAIREEKLGHHPAPDLLTVSFSQVDTIGHSYGPDSHEVMDSVLRLDRVIASLLDCLESEVGLKNCVLVLTADHGIPPTPERVQALRPDFPAGRIRTGEMDTAVRKSLTEAFGALPENEYWFMRDGTGYHLRPSALKAMNVTVDNAAQVVKATLLQQAFIAQVFTRAEILAAEPDGESVIAKVRRSYYAPNDRDVVYVLRPYFMDRASTGTTHGTPHEYDTHVPQVWFGAGVKPGVHLERVGVDDIAPTLAALLGIPRPPQATGRQLF